MSDPGRYVRTSLTNLIGFVLIAAVVLPPWVFGCIHPRFYFALILLLAMAVACWIPLWLTNGLKRKISLWFLSPLLLVAGVCLFQIVSLPQAILKFASPSAVAIQAELLPMAREVDVAGIEILRTGWTAEQRISLYPAETWKHTTWLLSMLLLFVVVQTTSSLTSIRHLLFAMTANGAALAFVAIATFLNSETSGVVTWQWDFGSLQFGSFLNRNHFAFYINLCVGAGLGGWFARYREITVSQKKLTNDWQILLISTALVTMLTSLLICQSRGGISSTLVATAIMGVLFCQTKDFRRYSLAIVFVAIAIGFSLWVDESLLQSRTADFLFGNEVVDVGRLGIWNRLSRLILRFPLFGTGVGTVPFIEPITRVIYDDHIVKYAHNDYLQVLIEIGVVGFSGASLFLLRFGRCATQFRTRFMAADIATDENTLSLGILFAILTALIHSFVDFSMRMPGVAVTVLVLAACFVVMNHVASRKEGDIHHSMRVRGIVAALAVLIMFACGQHFWALDRAAQRVAAFDRLEENDPRCISELSQAVEAYPHNVVWQLLLAEHNAESDRTHRDRMKVAQHHAVTARDLCPIFAYAQADLARLADTFAEGDDPETYLRRAQLTDPTSAELFYLSGQQQLHANNLPTALKYWRTSLSLDGAHLNDILTYVDQSPHCLESDIVSVVPDDVDLLFQASEWARGAKRTSRLTSDSRQSAWLMRALTELQRLPSKIENGRQIYRRATLAAKLGREQQAISDYETALSLMPNQKAWRYQFARYLVSKDRISDAQIQLRRLVRMNAGTQAETLLQQISSSSLRFRDS